jgi:hypothetical protein
MGTVLVPVHKADRMDSIMYIKTDNHQQRHSPTNNLFLFGAYDFVWRLEGCGHDGNVKKERRKENKKKKITSAFEGLAFKKPEQSEIEMKMKDRSL